MDRERKVVWNASSFFIKQVVSLIAGLILPRYILLSYGTNVNGLVTSITQFLSIISLLDLGVGAVVQSTLYKPLADKDNITVSQIVRASGKFFRKIACVFIVYCIAIGLMYPLLLDEGFDRGYVITLIAIIAIGSFSQYYFGISYQLLLNADQKGYIPALLQTATIIINTIVCVCLMYFNASIHVVKLATVIIYLFRPIGQYIYISKKYRLIKNVQMDRDPIKQKWSGLIQHISAFVVGNADVMILTTFSTLSNVSIYSIYHSIIYVIGNLVMTCVHSFEPLWGNMLAKGEYKQIIDRFNLIETLMHSLVTILFISVGYLIVPFVSIYTSGVNDANYIQYPFAILMTVSAATQCIRMLYYGLIKAAGHYKETQNAAIVQVIINLSISLLLVRKNPLVAVALGTLVAMGYQIVYFVIYLSKKILCRDIKAFVRHFMVDLFYIAIMILILNSLNFDYNSLLQWFFNAIVIVGMSVSIRIVIGLMFYKKEMLLLVKRIRNKDRD